MEKYYERSFCFSSKLQFEYRTRITNVSMLFLHSLTDKLTNLVPGCSPTQVANVAVKTKINRIFHRSTMAQKCHGNSSSITAISTSLWVITQMVMGP